MITDSFKIVGYFTSFWNMEILTEVLNSVFFILSNCGTMSKEIFKYTGDQLKIDF